MAATEDKPTELAVGTGEGEVHKVDQGDDMAGGLFQDVLFDVIRSDKLPESDAQKLIKEITDQGGRYLSLDSDSRDTAQIHGYTHLISSTVDFPAYENASLKLIPVVKPAWVQACLSRKKLTNPRQFSPDPRLFMNDVVLCCADIPAGDKEAIVGAVLALGGQYTGSLSRAVTHLVALTLDTEKSATAVKKGLACKIVLPHWFDDCLKLGRKIDESPYTLPSPEILSKGPSAVKHHHENKDLYGASSTNEAVAGALPTPGASFTDTSARRTRSVFCGKKIVLSTDLQLGDHLRDTLHEIIADSGGELVTAVHDADIFICQYRDGSDYISAFQAGKDVGNLAWLYYLITHDAWTSPMRRILHYPVPRNGVPGFSDCKISVSNYTGEARIYLENLIKAAGAEYTKTMRQENTHLITAHTVSEKCAAAKEWNIDIVNHLWLEESYAKCQVQTLTNQRYTYFPPRTNLGDVVGQTQIDRDAIRKYYIEQYPPYTTSAQITPSKTLAKKKQPAATPSNAVTIELSSGLPVQTPAERVTATAGQLKQINGDVALRTPLSRQSREGKENETPRTKGSRGAKDRALSRLHDMAPDLALYEKEMKRVGGVVYGGRKASDSDRLGSPGHDSTPRKRSVEPDLQAEEKVSTDDSQRKNKRTKTTKDVPLHTILLSGDNRWVDKAKKQSDETTKLRELGIDITEQPEQATVLCAPNIIRTRKFVCAIAFSPAVVKSSFLDYCLRNDKIPAVERHLLVDKESENRYGFKLADALQKAKENNRALLKGWQVFCTESVHGGFETFRDIIAVNGGVCHLYRGRGNFTLAKRKAASASTAGLARNTSSDDGDTVYLISGTNSDDEKVWSKFKQMATKQRLKARIAKPDWLLFVAMAQYVTWDDKWNLDPER